MSVDVMEKATIEFLLNEPFFSRFMMGRIKASKSIPTAATDMKNIYYNEEWISTLTVPEIKGVILHEILHIVYKHGLRMRRRNQYKWNMACDFVINLEVLDHGYELPKGGLLDKKFAGMTAEQVYNLLPDMPEMKVLCSGGDGRGIKSGDQDPNSCPLQGDLLETGMTYEEEQELSEKITQEIVAIGQMCKQEGRESSKLQDLVYKETEPKVNWRAYLHQFVSSTDKSDYSWQRRNRRYQGKFYLPALYKEVIGEVVLAVDTSGSIDEDLLSEFIGEINGVKDQVGAQMTLVYCDTIIRSEQTFDVGERLEFRPKGGGGTMFSPVMEWVVDKPEEPACMIYFTDGYCNDFGEDPEIPILWAVYNNKDFNPPFGEVMYLEL